MLGLLLRSGMEAGTTAASPTLRRAEARREHSTGIAPVPRGARAASEQH